VLAGGIAELQVEEPETAAAARGEAGRQEQDRRREDRPLSEPRGQDAGDPA
jgi:hypothetical protein